MRSLLRQVASVVCVFAFTHNAVASCAGWQATPEARMQCCQDGACPLHHHEHDAPGTQITQGDADDCCALSSQHESSPSKAAFATTMTIAVLQVLPPAVAPSPVLTPLPAPWATASPPPHVAKHLLLSVLIV